MNELEEMGNKKEKTKQVSKFVAFSLIGISAGLGISVHIVLFNLINFVYDPVFLSYWDFMIKIYVTPPLIIFIIVTTNSISVPGFIALGVYTYFQYLRLENYIFLRSEKRYQPKLKHRVYYIALIQMGVYTAWCFFSAFLFNFLYTAFLLFDIYLLAVMACLPGIYCVLKRLT